MMLKALSPLMKELVTDERLLHADVTGYLLLV